MALEGGEHQSEIQHMFMPGDPSPMASRFKAYCLELVLWNVNAGLILGGRGIWVATDL